jgi:nuclear cap-binding protein subunit 1
MPNPDPASIIIKSADGNEVDWFMDMCNRLSAARTDGSWHIASIPAIAEPFVEKLASTTNAHSLNGIQIPEKTFTNHAEASAKYPGRSMLRYVHQRTRRDSLVRWR